MAEFVRKNLDDAAEEIRGHLDTIEQEGSDAETEIEDLKMQILALEEERDGLVADVKGLQEEVEDLKAQLAE